MLQGPGPGHPGVSRIPLFSGSFRPTSKTPGEDDLVVYESECRSNRAVRREDHDLRRR